MAKPAMAKAPTHCPKNMRSTIAFQVLPNEKCTVSLYNTNGELVSSLQGASNEYGSFSGSFTIPDNGNTGSYGMRFSTEKGKNYYHDIRVEEYKRPSFYASIAVPEAAYKLNDSISMTGSCMAYAGYGIDHATVKYHITRHSGYYNRWGFCPATTKEIASGETYTDAEGMFNIQFLASALKEYSYYEYVITADITDMSGETHSCNTSIKVGNTAMNICLDIPSKIQKNQQTNSFPLLCPNMSGKNQQAKVHYTIFALNTPQHFLHANNSNTNVDAIDSADFVKQIPFMAYHQENKMPYWTTSKIVAEGDVLTGDSSVLLLDDLVEKYGADTLRMYEMFLGPLEQSKPWDTKGIEGAGNSQMPLLFVFVASRHLLSAAKPS